MHANAASMAQMINCLFGVVNFVGLILSIVAVVFVASLWPATQCGRLVQGPTLALAAIVLVLSLVGLVGACWRRVWVFCVYLVIMSLLIMGLFGVTVFAVTMIREVHGVEDIPGKAYKEFRPVSDDSASWLAEKLFDNWATVKSCLIHDDVCRPMIKNSSMSVEQFYNKTLTPVQSGCCKPSNDCNFQYISPTIWLHTNESTPTKNNDCMVWSNAANVWCLDCQACKAAVVFHLNMGWVRLAAVSFIILVFFCVVYTIGFYALRSHSRGGWKGLFPDDIK